jgi:hypothetical protein
MTCIVGLKHNNKIYIGGDSLGINDKYQKTIRLDEKVFIKNDMIFGFTHSFRMGQIIRYAFDIPQRMVSLTDMDYLVGHFIPALMQAYEEHGFLKKADDSESEGGTFILGYNGTLYCIEDDFQVGIPKLPYIAVGAGEDVAMGSMFTTGKLDKKVTPEKRISLALDAATEHSAAVSPPYVILSI